MSQSIFGYSWDQIRRCQQGDNNALSGPAIDLSKPSKKPATEKDKALLAEYGEAGLRERGLFGVLDRLNLPLT